MNKDRLENLLKKLSDQSCEKPNPGLCDKIKEDIPENLRSHKVGNTFNIIIDLRISKWAAAAAIVLAFLFLFNVFGYKDFKEDGLLKNGEMLFSYVFKGKEAIKADDARLKTNYNYLVKQGKEVVFYGDKLKQINADTVLMHWKIKDGEYMVLFGDFSKEKVSAEELIDLQGEMIDSFGSKE